MKGFIRARLRLLSTEVGGRKDPILRKLRPDWNLSQTWKGAPALNGGSISLEGIESLAPGDEGIILILPRSPEDWTDVAIGTVLPMHEGARAIGHATVLGLGVEAEDPD